MYKMDALEKYVKAQENTYQLALSEIKAGKKQTHWVWFIFPTIANRFAPTHYNIKYALQNKQEAINYLNHPILGPRLIEITTELYNSKTVNIENIFPKPDIKKINACLTLFNNIPATNPIFLKSLNKFFNNQQDDKTIQLLTN